MIPMNYNRHSSKIVKTRTINKIVKIQLRKITDVKNYGYGVTGNEYEVRANFPDQELNEFCDFKHLSNAIDCFNNYGA